MWDLAVGGCEKKVVSVFFLDERSRLRVNLMRVDHFWNDVPKTKTQTKWRRDKRCWALEKKPAE